MVSSEPEVILLQLPYFSFHSAKIKNDHITYYPNQHFEGEGTKEIINYTMPADGN